MAQRVQRARKNTTHYSTKSLLFLIALCVFLSSTNGLETIYNPLSNTVSCGQTDDCNIICNGTNICESKQFILNSSNHCINITCIGHNACKSSLITSRNHSHLFVLIHNNSAPNISLTVYNDGNGISVIQCLDDESCNSGIFNIHSNYGDETAFYCGDHSCINAAITSYNSHFTMNNDGDYAFQYGSLLIENDRDQSATINCINGYYSCYSSSIIIRNYSVFAFKADHNSASFHYGSLEVFDGDGDGDATIEFGDCYTTTITVRNYRKLKLTKLSGAYYSFKESTLTVYNDKYGDGSVDFELQREISNAAINFYTTSTDNISVTITTDNTQLSGDEFNVYNFSHFYCLCRIRGAFSLYGDTDSHQHALIEASTDRNQGNSNFRFKGAAFLFQDIDYVEVDTASGGSGHLGGASFDIINSNFVLNSRGGWRGSPYSLVFNGNETNNLSIYESSYASQSADITVTHFDSFYFTAVSANSATISIYGHSMMDEKVEIICIKYCNNINILSYDINNFLMSCSSTSVLSCLDANIVLINSNAVVTADGLSSLYGSNLLFEGSFSNEITIVCSGNTSCASNLLRFNGGRAFVVCNVSNGCYGTYIDATQSDAFHLECLDNCNAMQVFLPLHDRHNMTNINVTSNTTSESWFYLFDSNTISASESWFHCIDGMKCNSNYILIYGETLATQCTLFVDCSFPLYDSNHSNKWIYFDESYVNVSNVDTNIYIFPYLADNAQRNTQTLTTASDANVTVLCIYCYGIDFHFNTSLNAVIIAGKAYHNSDIYGPKDSFRLIQKGTITDTNIGNNYYLESTNSFDADCGSETIRCLSNSNLYFASDFINLNIDCRGQESNCYSTDIYTSSNYSDYHFGSLWNIECNSNPQICAQLMIYFNDANCLYNDSSRCEYMLTFAPTAAPTFSPTNAPSLPSTSPTNAPSSSPTLPSTSPTNAPDAVCEEPTTFVWEELMSDDSIQPEATANLSINALTLTLNIVVNVDYLGATGADNNGYVYGTTYVIDFEDYSAESDNIREPGTCQNRETSDILNTASWDDVWAYSSTPNTAGHIGSTSYLAYAPGGLWSVQMSPDDECTVQYTTSLTWDELTGCRSFDGTQSYIATTDTSDTITLSGTLYVNVVSPFAYQDEYGYYRVYQLISQPFEIVVHKTVYVIGETGINLLNIDIIAVYKEDEENIFKLIVLTESAEYLELSRTNLTDSLLSFTPDTDTGLTKDDFTVLETAETATSICLQSKTYICSQLWLITAKNAACSKADDKYTDFSGSYSMEFNAECRSDSGVDASLHGYCVDWLEDHESEITDSNTGRVVLSADLTWKDTICDPIVFEVQFAANMEFFEDYQFVDLASNTHLYQVGEDTVYVRVTTSYPADHFSVFETKLVNVWLCTFDPLTSPDDIEVGHMIGGCFSNNTDADAFAHIYDNANNMTLEEFAVDSVSTQSNIVEFEFKVPTSVTRDTLYVHAQIEVSLTESGGRRRRMIMDVDMVSQVNQMDHFVDKVGITQSLPINKRKPPNHDHYHPQQPQNPPQTLPNPQQPFVISLQSKWVIVIGCLLVVVLTLNIAFMWYMKWKKPILYVAINAQDSNSEFDECSERDAINVVSD